MFWTRERKFHNRHSIITRCVIINTNSILTGKSNFSLSNQMQSVFEKFITQGVIALFFFNKSGNSSNIVHHFSSNTLSYIFVQLTTYLATFLLKLEQNDSYLCYLKYSILNFQRDLSAFVNLLLLLPVNGVDLRASAIRFIKCRLNRTQIQYQELYIFLKTTVTKK